MTDQKTLYGHADPVGGWMGFLVPVFTAAGSNGLFAQRLDGDLILDFEQIEDVRVEIEPDDPVTALEGSEARYAFAFARDDIVSGGAENFRTSLAARLEDPLFRHHPLLALEAAEFLELSVSKLRFVRAAADLLSKLGERAVTSWLDAAVLTPDVRARLAARGGAAAAIAHRLTAGTIGGRIVVRGAPSVRDGEGFEVESAVREALRELADVYPEPRDGGWTIHLVERLVTRKPAEAIVWLADDKTGEIGAHASAPPSWRVDVIPTVEIARFREAMTTPEARSFVAVHREADEPIGHLDGMFDADVVLIRFGSLRRLERGRRPRLLTGSRHRQIYVASAGIPGTNMSARSAGRLIRQVTAASVRVGLASTSDDREWVYFRTAGAKPDRRLDAWCALYDRIWATGLSPRRALLFSGSAGSSYSGRSWSRIEPEDLFHDGRVIHDERVALELRASRSDAAVLLPLEHLSDSDREGQGRIVEAVLSRTEWNLVGVDRSPDAARLEVGSTPASALRWFVVPSRPPAGKISVEFNALLDRDLRSLEIAAVTCDATATNILAHLHARWELSVNMRDLCLAEGRPRVRTH